jgi:hypothetical protein
MADILNPVQSGMRNFHDTLGFQGGPPVGSPLLPYLPSVVLMLTLDFAKWDQSADDLRQEAMNAPHPRTRERFLALYDLACQGQGASAVARATGRHLQTLIRWVHRYNASGPLALTFEHTGGVSPFLTRSRSRRSRR